MLCWHPIVPVTVCGVLRALPMSMWVLWFWPNSQKHTSGLATRNVPGCTQSMAAHPWGRWCRTPPYRSAIQQMIILIKSDVRLIHSPF